ncbi:MAG: hypothetical protein A3A97_02370 [Candidatus Terrybacteria bacterium RIFCSPLOWO2_01_FULL_40_23]|uniref:GIY-YIG domain-containing protein n=1 Tax=Candidatus Terrybacteria bacterium RIFCSPLOWO2_01_FULL_40_23 TaxID=1802366 RepID=A0A1G2PSG9_9BACT|nr:MAG: hypothetical protein A3A97_02370 [Candidatus Terrybacteria bacterium RIFCSPLOWO2_01_FULL_40_23]
MWIVYIIQHDKTKQLYSGFTNDLKRRLLKHNSGESIATKRKHGKWHLIYAEAYKDRKDAVLRERKLKNHGTAKQRLYERISNSLLK